MERGIRVQRLRLLRIVAGLLAAVALVSMVPFSSECRRWAREAICSLLSRVECAGRHLVIAQAVVLAGPLGQHLDRERFFHAANLDGPLEPVSGMTPPRLRALRSRLWALRALLLDLPRYGCRLLRRVLRGRAKQAGVVFPVLIDLPGLGSWRLAVATIERPPDD